MKNKILFRIKRWFVPLLGGATATFTIATAIPAGAQCVWTPSTVLCNTPSSYRHYTRCLGIFPANLYKIKYAGFHTGCVVGSYKPSTYGSTFSASCTYSYKWLTCWSKGSQTNSIPWTGVNCYTCAGG